MRILLVEDDDRISRPLAIDLRHQNHTVDIASDGVMGLEFAEAVQYDLILLDLLLPKMDGITLCKQLRDNGSNSLILMLTARDTTADKVIGLDAGADDYLVKPFKLEELEARIRALSRRAHESKIPILSYGKLQIDTATREVSYNRNLLSLTPKEYMILECFLHNPMKVLTRSEIMDKLWELDKLSGEDTIRTHITNLRRKLKISGAEENFIETVYGVGYRLVNREI